MSETLGGLIDQLITNNMKLWKTQDDVYRYERMSETEFQQVPHGELHRLLKRLSQINLERNRLMCMIDTCFADGVRTGLPRVDARIKITE